MCMCFLCLCCFLIFFFFLPGMFLSYQMLVSEVQSYGEKKTCAENAASQLLELSRKEDCDVVQNLLITVQDRYRKLQQHTTERGKTLEDVRKQVKQVIDYNLTKFIKSLPFIELHSSSLSGRKC